MKPGINFTPGPSQLYFTVDDHVRKAFKEGIPSLSHRSKQFESIYQSTKEGLTELLNIPSGFHIVFCASATEIWERIIQNLVEKESHHFVNGAFSKRFYEIALQLGKHAIKTEANTGKSFEPFTGHTTGELIALTHNETSTGVSLTMPFINQFKEQFPKALVAVDAVSSLPYPEFDFSKIDSVFFSVQKGFGLPAGLGVWIVNEKCIGRAESLLSKGTSIGSYHTLPSLIEFEKKNQTPETPNVLGIYLLSKVVHDMARKGALAIRKETEYKAAILYHALQQHTFLKPFVAAEQDRSKTVIVAESGEHTQQVTDVLQTKGLFPGEGYGTLKKSQLRFANFPTHSKEQYEYLVDVLSDIR
jgi:phosphoserine aminotransferase